MILASAALAAASAGLLDRAAAEEGLPATPGRDAEQRLAQPAGLGAFFAALDALERKQATRPLRILQIGDSHTANDAFSSAMRERLQARFGAAGRGWLPAGVPYKYFQPRQVSVAETGWRHVGPAEAAQAMPLGLDATVAESLGAGSRMSLASTEPEGFNRFGIEFLTQPKGASLTIRIDQRRPVSVPTEAPEMHIKRVEMSLPGVAHQVELATHDRQPAAILGWTVERRRPGVIYENHGTVGATIGLIGKMNPSAVAFELAERRPALIVVAFGTNEGFDDSLDPKQYAETFAEAVGALHERAPEAAILLLGPPDGDRLDKACAQSADAAKPATPALSPAAAPECVADGSAANSCAWRPPRNLAVVRQAQKRLAAQRGWAFWDWSQALGGACGMHRLVGRDPPLAAPDHVHMTKAGYTAAAEVLFGDLMAEYEKWKHGRVARR
ncbi:MAG: hypothetical protein JO267_14810 [Alphaproteobacteria bacterium]|nr:hypothetical protein [Alphaproteobacteria bacterium]